MQPGGGGTQPTPVHVSFAVLAPPSAQDELKKLYAQLEVHKTKEMAANNPHLPTKRGSSRRGLGRSFMRYLAEFPEALARQHSRDWGSPGRSSLPGSSRRRLLSSGSQEPEGPRALRKSCSAYDHDRRGEREPPLLDSLLRRKLAKKAPRRESRAAVEAPPALGFRSASAHNLTVGERLPRARPASLQKSLSVMAGSSERALLVASQAYLEETYRQAKEREERKKAASLSPVRRLSARRLEGAGGAPLSAPPSPAKSRSVDTSRTSGNLQEAAARRTPHPPIQHQVSTPITALAGACPGEPRMLSPTSTLTPALIPAPVPVSPANPSLLTFICPWENAELPVKKDHVPQEGPPGPGRGDHSPAPARARLWRALSVAMERKGAKENGMDTEDSSLQGGGVDVDEDRPKVFSKSHSLKTPVSQGSVRSLGLAIKALTRSRSTHREKESGEGSPEREEGSASGEGMGACPRSPRLGRHKVVSKQAALAPCEDEESLQNEQNAHTSRMLRVCHQEGSREQEDRGSRAPEGQGVGRVERAGKTGPATLRQVRQGTDGDKNAEQAQESPVGRQELLKAGLQPLGSADCRVAEVCPWEVSESGPCPPDSSNKAEICPWEVSEGVTERGALRQDLDDTQEEKGKVSEESQPKDVVAIARKKPERLVRGQEAVCPWENADPGDPSPQSAPQDSERTKGMSEAGDTVEAREVEKHQQEVTGPEACTLDTAKAELCPKEESGGKNEKLSQEGVKKLPQVKQKSPKKATFWEEQKLGRDLECLCSWERTDFRGPSAVSAEVPGTPECSGTWGSSLVEVCPWEAAEAPAIKKAEICPWELNDEVVGKEVLHQGTAGEPLQEEGQVSLKGLFGETGEQTGKAMQTSSPQQESVCPWESTAPEHSSPHLDDSSSRAGGQLLSKGGSRVTQVCPWEVLRPEVKAVTPAKAEICPWEVNERTTEDWTSGQSPKGESLKEKEKMPGTSGIQDVTAWEKPEGQIQKQEAVCPWECVDPGSFPPQPGPGDTDRPKASSQVSVGTGSKVAVICPWDLKETLPAEKAEICPWEVSAGPGQGRALGVEAIRKLPDITGEASTEPGPGKTAATAPKPEVPAQEPEVACSRENVDPGGSSQHLDTIDRDRPEARFQDLDHGGYRPAKLCPWEMEQVSPSEKAKLCPWEVNEGATGKGQEQEMGSGSAGQRGKTLERGRLTSLEEDTSKKETKLSQEWEAICPWEKDLREPSVQGPEVSDPSSGMGSKVVEGQSLEVSDEAAEKQDPKTGSLQEHITREQAPSSNAEVTTEDGGKASKELQSICPRESTALASSSAHPIDQCPDQPSTGSQRPVSVERRAEVCPWDAPALDARQPDGSAKAEICPWEVTARIPEKRVSTQGGKGEPQEEEKVPEKPEPKVVAVQEKPDGKQEAVCPWESQESGGLSPQTAPQASDRSKGSCAGSVGARGAEACLWEAEEAPSAKRTEICPWKVSKAAAEEGGSGQDVDREPQGQGELFLQEAESRGMEEHFSKAAAKGSREQETVCPCEGIGSGGLFPQPDAPDTDQPKVSPHRASSVGSRTTELCQWEVTDPEGNKIMGTMADICPWEGTGTLPEESGPPALTATQTELFFPTAPENPPCLSVQRPLGGFLPESKSSRPKVSKPVSTFTLEGVQELQGPLGLGPRTNLAPEPSLQEAEAQKSSFLMEDQGEGASKAPHEELAPPTVYPWDWE